MRVESLLRGLYLPEEGVKSTVEDPLQSPGEPGWRRWSSAPMVTEVHVRGDVLTEPSTPLRCCATEKKEACGRY